MENIKVMTLTGKAGVLTTDHAASSYGMPVLLVDGVAYGPGDKLGREYPLVAQYRGSQSLAGRTIDIKAALSTPPDDPAIGEWNKRVVEIHTAGKHWDDAAGGYAPPRCNATGHCETTGAHITVTCECGAVGTICPQRKRIYWAVTR